MAARTESPKFSKLGELTNSNFVSWRENIVMLHKHYHYLTRQEIPDNKARRQIFACEIKYGTSLICKSVEEEFIDIVDRNRSEPWDTMTDLGQTCMSRSKEGISLLKSKLYRMKLTDYSDVHSFLSSLRTTLVINKGHYVTEKSQQFYLIPFPLLSKFSNLLDNQMRTSYSLWLVIHLLLSQKIKYLSQK